MDGPRPGRPKKADRKVHRLIASVLGQCPSVFGYLFTIWTVLSLRAHVSNVLGYTLSTSTIRRVLHNLNYRWKRPRHTISKRDPQARAKIKKLLSCIRPGINIVFADETDVHLLPTLRAMWAKVGKQVRILTPGSNQKRSIFGGLNVRTGELIHYISQRKRAVDFIAFLEKLVVAYPKGKLYVVLDNCSIHRAKAVQEWVPKHPHVEFVFLPLYSPHLNPIEKVWWRLKGTITANKLYSSINELIKTVERFFSKMTPDELQRLVA